MLCNKNGGIALSEKNPKSSMRKRADAIKPYQCKNLIAVIEDPKDIKILGQSFET